VLGKLLRLGDEAYAYLPESTLRFASRETLAAAMERAGFVDVAYRDLMFGNLCVHWGRKP
jgi:demethylmenaquinone methyltransferase/2-methoxy-6-polyprenyl-1,4-benzoquinol methylase